MKTLIQMLKLLRNYRWRLIQFFIIALIYAGFHSSFALVSKTAVEILEGNVPGWMPVADNKEALTLVILCGVILLLGKCIFQYIRRYLQSWLSKRIVIGAY